MATIVDPGGTPTPVYNVSGVTVQTVTAAGAFDPSTATQIIAYSEYSIIIVIGAASNAPGVVMPASPNVADVVEIHFADVVTGSSEVAVWATPTSMLTLYAGQITNNGVFLRYLGPTYGWGYIGVKPS